MRRNRCNYGDSRGGGSGRGTALEEAQGEAGIEVDSSVSSLRDRCGAIEPLPPHILMEVHKLLREHKLLHVVNLTSTHKKQTKWSGMSI